MTFSVAHYLIWEQVAGHLDKDFAYCWIDLQLLVALLHLLLVMHYPPDQLLPLCWCSQVLSSYQVRTRPESSHILYLVYQDAHNYATSKTLLSTVLPLRTQIRPSLDWSHYYPKDQMKCNLDLTKSSQCVDPRCRRLSLASSYPFQLCF